jgi:hypothetical protein
MSFRSIVVEHIANVLHGDGAIQGASSGLRPATKSRFPYAFRVTFWPGRDGACPVFAITEAQWDGFGRTTTRAGLFVTHFAADPLAYSGRYVQVQDRAFPAFAASGIGWAFRFNNLQGTYFRAVSHALHCSIFALAFL